MIRLVEERTGIRAVAVQANLLDAWSHVASVLSDTGDEREQALEQLDRAEEHFRVAVGEQTTAIASHRLADVAQRWDEYVRSGLEDVETLRLRERVGALIDESRRLGLLATSWSDVLTASRLAIDAMDAVTVLDQHLDGQLGKSAGDGTSRPFVKAAPVLELDGTPGGGLVVETPNREDDTPVVKKLDFSGLDPEGFERLVFSLISSDTAYVNPAWLTRINAPDRGRDLSVERIVTDGLLGSRRDRVFVQCRHTLASLTATDVERAVTPLRLWEPPPVHYLVLATTARFTTDAVQWIENFNQEGSTQIVMWPDSHLELLLAGRPLVVDAFGLGSNAPT